MIVGNASVDRPIHWLVEHSQPATVALRSLPGWQFVHPLIRIYPRLGADQITPLEDGAVHVACQTISFIVSSEDHQALRNGAEAFLRYLRLATKQAGLPTDVALTGFSTPESLPELDAPKEASGAVLRPDLRATAVTLGHVSSAEFDLGFQAPVHATMLLDAIDASYRDDHRAAILYAAIAIEVLANTRIDEEFEALRIRVPDPAHLRIIKASGSGPTQVRTDPIYKLLRKRARRSFRTLLYELPLYVLGRSLCTDDAALYNETLKLYETRNQISHRGIEDPSSGVLSVDRAGASTAVSCATRVFTWFGEHGWT